MKNIQVMITDDLRVLANILGGFRTLVARNAGVKDAKMGAQLGVESDQDGMLAELCFAKAANVWPDLGLSPRSGSHDAMFRGMRVDIKSTRYPNGRLLSTLKANKDIDMYVLAIIQEDRVIFPGYALAKDLIDDKNITDLGHGKGYALTQDQLKSF